MSNRHKIDMNSFYQYSADFIALIHGLWAVTVVIGPLFIFKWPRFKIVHLTMMIITLILIFLGRYCPLTFLEKWLREQQGPGMSYEGGFIIHYFEKIGVDIPPKVFGEQYPTINKVFFTLSILLKR